MVAMTEIPVLRRKKQEDQTYKAIFSYLMTLRLAWYT